MRWRKIPRIQKWIGYKNRKHCATIMIDSKTQKLIISVDGGNGFQRLIFAFPEGTPIKEYKSLAEIAQVSLAIDIDIESYQNQARSGGSGMNVYHKGNRDE